MGNMRDRRRTARLKREADEAEAALLASKPRWHAPTPMAWFCIVLAVVLLFGLSIWQMMRLEWKEGLIADITANQFKRAYMSLPEDVDVIRDTMNFARVRLHGIFLHDEEAHLVARRHNARLGYHVLTPFKLDDGRVVLLNRGWVPLDNKESETRALGQLSGPQTIVAMIRLDNDRNYFTPNHDIDNNMWSWKDIETVAQTTGYDIFPVNMDVLYDTPASGMPIPSKGLMTLRNDHLGYALTWFMIGVSGLIIFITYHYRAPEKKQIQNMSEV